MKNHSLNPNATSIVAALIAGIASSVGKDEREGVPMGFNGRNGFNVLLVGGDNAPSVQDGRIMDSYPRLAASSPGSQDLVLWLEKTPVTKRDQNASLVRIENCVGYTTIKGLPQVKASGPNTVLVQFEENSAIAIQAQNGQEFVLYTEDNAREPKFVVASEFQAILASWTGADNASTRAKGSRTTESAGARS